MRPAVVAFALVTAFAPLALADHAPTEMSCEGDAETQILGGTVEHLVGLGPAGGLYCHFPMGCPTPEPCTVEVTLTVRGTGIVEGLIAPFDGEDARCGPTAGECTVASIVASGAAHEIHLNCGVGELTVAVLVEMECAAGPA